MILGLHHVALSAADPERLAGFYCALFGFEVEYRGSWEQGDARIDAMVGLDASAADYLVLGREGARLEIFGYRSPAPAPAVPWRPVCDHGITHLCLQVTGIDAEVARLAHAGMRFHCPPPPASAGQRHRATYGRDPEGNVIELIEILSDHHPFGTRARA